MCAPNSGYNSCNIQIQAFTKQATHWSLQKKNLYASLGILLKIQLERQWHHTEHLTFSSHSKLPMVIFNLCCSTTRVGTVHDGRHWSGTALAFFVHKVKNQSTRQWQFTQSELDVGNIRRYSVLFISFIRLRTFQATARLRNNQSLPPDDTGVEIIM